MCLGTERALLIRAKMAEISLQAQPYYRESCQTGGDKKVGDRQSRYKNNVPELLIKQLPI